MLLVKHHPLTRSINTRKRDHGCENSFTFCSNEGDHIASVTFWTTTTRTFMCQSPATQPTLKYYTNCGARRGLGELCSTCGGYKLWCYSRETVRLVNRTEWTKSICLALVVLMHIPLLLCIFCFPFYFSASVCLVFFFGDRPYLSLNPRSCRC